MKIQLFFDEGPGADNIRKIVASIVSSVAIRVGVDISNIKITGIATEDTYGEAVDILFPGSGYTNSNEFVGVGKTETKTTINGPEHTLLFRDYVFSLLFEGFSVHGEEVFEWPPRLQEAIYMVAHELGHCRFNESYPRNIEWINETRLILDDFDKIDDHQLSVLVGEVGACYYGDRYYSDKLFKYASENALISIENLFKDLNTAKSQNDIKGVAYLAHGVTWLYTIQYSKVATGVLGTEFEDLPVEPPSMLRDFAEVHNLLSLAVSDFCNSRFKDIETFTANIALARELLLEHHLEVRILKDENGKWCCFWN